MDHQSRPAISYIVFMGRDFRGCGKKRPTVCHSERSEESLFLLLSLNPREILRFAQNDNMNYFFRSLFSRDVREFEEQGPQPLPPHHGCVAKDEIASRHAFSFVDRRNRLRYKSAAD
jgi:hypothetical protein